MLPLRDELAAIRDIDLVGIRSIIPNALVLPRPFVHLLIVFCVDIHQRTQATRVIWLHSSFHRFSARMAPSELLNSSIFPSVFSGILAQHRVLAHLCAHHLFDSRSMLRS